MAVRLRTGSRVHSGEAVRLAIAEAACVERKAPLPGRSDQSDSPAAGACLAEHLSAAPIRARRWGAEEAEQPLRVKLRTAPGAEGRDEDCEGDEREGDRRGAERRSPRHPPELSKVHAGLTRQGDQSRPRLLAGGSNRSTADGRCAQVPGKEGSRLTNPWSMVSSVWAVETCCGLSAWFHTVGSSIEPLKSNPSQPS